jgi:hypothetical protein
MMRRRVSPLDEGPSVGDGGNVHLILVVCLDAPAPVC